VAKSRVVFDMDGVLVDSEPLWVRARQDLVRAAGGRWLPEAETAMMGISSDRWSAYMHDRLGLEHLTPERIRAEVIERMIALYRAQVPLLPGARAAVETTAARWPLAVASGSDRVLLDTVLASSGLADCFTATESALAAGMKGVAIPRLGFEPGPGVLSRATAVLPDLTRLDPDLVTGLLAS
jgi:beta-phosphoglucomutase-like phosphatase (HAD superfamily)